MSAPLKIAPVRDPVEECSECDGVGSCECEECHGEGTTECECDSCGHEHDRECRECDGDGLYACDVCHGFGCLAAAREWERDKVLPLIPSDVLRSLLQLAPHLDAAGLPQFGVRVEGASARPVITVEARRGNADAEDILCAGGWRISLQTVSSARKSLRRWEWRGQPVRLDVRRADGGAL